MTAAALPALSEEQRSRALAIERRMARLESRLDYLLSPGTDPGSASPGATDAPEPMKENTAA